MKKIQEIATRKLMEMIRQIDPDPGASKPVTFWFYSKGEANIYRLAAVLRNAGYKIITCENSANAEILCIAEIRMPADNEEISRRCIDMHVLAEKMEVTFDGWEMALNIEQ